MRRSVNSLPVFLFVMVLLALSVFGQSAGHGLEPTGIDEAANPCQDFYQYANGKWLSTNPIPPAYPQWGVANVLDEQNREIILRILLAAATNTKVAKGTNEQKVGDYYASCMD